MDSKTKLLLLQPCTDTCYEYISSLGLINLKNIASEYVDVTLIDDTVTDFKKSIQKILSQKYDIIGISGNFTNSIPYCIKYAYYIKKKYPDTLLISGGNHVTFKPNDLLNNKFDIILYSETEISFKIFLKNYIQNKHKIYDTPGIFYKKNNKLIQNKSPELIQNLDSLPMPDFSNLYSKQYYKISNFNYITLENSRGCKYNCRFCSTVKMWKPVYRHKSAERMLKEFRLAQEHNIEFIFLVDDDFGLDEKHVIKFCKLLLKNNINIFWGTTIGLNSIKNKSTFNLMKKSGCLMLSICVESASDKVLDYYRKPFRQKHFFYTVNNLKRNKIFIHNHGVIGAPVETFKDMLNTFKILMESSPVWHISILEPRPGSDLANEYNFNQNKYKYFGKANVFFGKYFIKKIFIYMLYRTFFTAYLLNPIRLIKIIFIKNKIIRYQYLIQYYIAYNVLKMNIKHILDFIFNYLNKYINI